MGSPPDRRFLAGRRAEGRDLHSRYYALRPADPKAVTHHYDLIDANRARYRLADAGKSLGGTDVVSLDVRGRPWLKAGQTLTLTWPDGTAFGDGAPIIVVRTGYRDPKAKKTTWRIDVRGIDQGRVDEIMTKRA